MTTAAIDPGLFESSVLQRAQWMNELASFDESARFSNRLGCPLVLVGSLADERGMRWSLSEAAEVLRRAGDLAAKSGVYLGVRNHADTSCATGAELASLLAEVDHPHVGVAWSPVEAHKAGADAVADLKVLLASQQTIHYVSVRDGKVQDGEWEPCTVGEGDVEWPTLLEMMAQTSFNGVLAIEEVPLREDQSIAKAGLSTATALIELICAARRSEGG